MGIAWRDTCRGKRKIFVDWDSMDREVFMEVPCSMRRRDGSNTCHGCVDPQLHGTTRGQRRFLVRWDRRGAGGDAVFAVAGDGTTFIRPLWMNEPHHGGEDRWDRARTAARARADFRRRKMGQRKTIPAQTRRQVLAAGCCAWCGATDNLSIDHIIPWSMGGSDDIENLRCLCRSCNSRRGAARIPDPVAA